MTWAIYDNMGAMQASVGSERTHSERVTIALVEAVIRNVPEKTSEEDLRQWLYSTRAIVIQSETAVVAPEHEWPADVRRMISGKTCPYIELSWNR
jgi:hypothetical protein